MIHTLLVLYIQFFAVIFYMKNFFPILLRILNRIFWKETESRSVREAVREAISRSERNRPERQLLTDAIIESEWNQETENEGYIERDIEIVEDNEVWMTERRWIEREEEQELQYTAKEYWNMVIDPQTNQIQIGLSIEVVDTQDTVIICIDVLMTSDLFFRFPIQTAKDYMIGLAREYGDVVLFASDLEDATRVYGLLDVCETPIVLNTYILRMIQRKWRRMYAEKMQKWRERGSLMAQRHFELHGNYRWNRGSVVGSFVKSHQI